MKLKNETIATLMSLQRGEDITIRLRASGVVDINGIEFEVNKDFDDDVVIGIVKNYLKTMRKDI